MVSAGVAATPPPWAPGAAGIAAGALPGVTVPATTGGAESTCVTGAGGGGRLMKIEGMKAIAIISMTAHNMRLSMTRDSSLS
jgi:hypothetical protein